MRTPREVMTLYEIGSTRPYLAAVETSLIVIEGDIVPLTGSPVASLTDLHFARLCNAESRFALLDAEHIGAVAGNRAETALRSYQDSFRAMHQTYGLACGPDRDQAGLEKLHDALRAVASQAYGHLTTYMGEIAGLDMPSFDAYADALEQRNHETRPVAAPEPKPITPRVRLPLPRDEAALRARKILGYAFGGLSAVYLTMKRPPERYAGMIALGDLAGVVARVGSWSSSLSRRCPSEFSVFADYAEGTSDALDALYHDLEEAVVVRRAGSDEITTLAETLIPHVRRLSAAIRTIEDLARRTDETDTRSKIEG